MLIWPVGSLSVLPYQGTPRGTCRGVVLKALSNVGPVGVHFLKGGVLSRKEAHFGDKCFEQPLRALLGAGGFRWLGSSYLGGIGKATSFRARGFWNEGRHREKVTDKLYT